jgi:hypothetical protein
MPPQSGHVGSTGVVESGMESAPSPAEQKVNGIVLRDVQP